MSRDSQVLRQPWWAAFRLAWLPVLFAMTGGVIAYSLASSSPVIYQAELVTVVPGTGSGPGIPSNPDQAQRLARTYAEIIPQSDLLVGEVARLTSLTQTAVKDATSVGNESSTGVIYLRTSGSTPEQALILKDAWASALVRSPVGGVVTPGSLEIVSVGTDVETTGTNSVGSGLFGAAAGLVLGLGLVWLLKQTNPRLWDLRDLHAALSAPVTPSDESGAAALTAWLQRNKMPDRPVEVLVIGGSSAPPHKVDGFAAAIEAASKSQDRATSTGVDVSRGGSLSKRWVPSPDAMSADLVVLCVRQGSTSRALRRDLAVLGESGLGADWGALVPIKSSSGESGGPTGGPDRSRGTADRSAGSAGGSAAP